MDNSKALSKEVSSLIATIQSQAAAYNAAFELFERNKLRFDKMLTDAYEFIEKAETQIDKSLNNNIDTINSQLYETIALFKKTQEVYAELEEIIELKDKLFHQQDVLRRFINEFETFKSNANSAIQSILDSLTPRVDQAVESEIEKLIQKHEIRISLQLKRFETKFLSTDQKYWTISDTQQRQHAELVEEIDGLKSRIISLSRNSTDLKKNLDNNQGDLVTVLNHKIQQLDSYLQQMDTEKLKSIDLKNKISWLENDYSEQMKAIDNSIQAINKALKSSENQRRITFLAATFSFIGLIVLLVYLLTK